MKNRLRGLGQFKSSSLLIVMVLFVGIGLFFVLRSQAAVCTGSCPPDPGIQVFDATGSRTASVDWAGEETILPSLPSNLKSPTDYTQNDAIMRLEVLEKPNSLKVGVIICFYGGGQERCSYTKGGPNYMTFTGPGTYYANLGKPGVWPNTLSGDWTWTNAPEEVYLQFVDEEKLLSILANGTDPDNLGETTAAVLNWLYKPDGGHAQHLPIKVSAEVFFTKPNTSFQQPPDWNCPDQVCKAVGPTSTYPEGAGGPTPTPGSETWQAYSDSHDEISYLGGMKGGCDDFSLPGWAVCSGQGGFFDESYHYTNTIGSAFEFSFTGTGVRIYSDVSDHAGVMDVTIDGAQQGTIDYYSSPYAQKIKVYEMTGLSSGVHTFKATLTGQNSQSTGTFVGLDRVEILGEIGANAPTPTPTSPPTPTPTATPTPTTGPTPTPDPNGNPADINGSGRVDVTDLSILIRNYKKTNATRAEGDVNGDGSISITDLSILVKAWGT